MSAYATITTPITGREALREALGEVTEPTQALARFYRAFNGRDLALMAENWENSDAVVMDNPVGGIMRGWPEINIPVARKNPAGSRDFLCLARHLQGIYGRIPIVNRYTRPRND